MARCLLQSSGSRCSMFALECGFNKFVMPPRKWKFSSYYEPTLDRGVGRGKMRAPGCKLRTCMMCTRMWAHWWLMHVLDCKFRSCDMGIPYHPCCKTSHWSSIFYIWYRTHLSALFSRHPTFTFSHWVKRLFLRSLSLLLACVEPIFLNSTSVH